MLRWWPWCAAILLLLWQVDFQFTYGFLADGIQKDLHLTASEATAVSSAFLFAYGTMQVPAGLLIDRFGVRWVLPIAGWAAAGAVLFFAHGESYGELAAGRMLAGIFMAFMFPAAGKIARVRLPAVRFALAMAIADMCFGIGALTASNMASFQTATSWRHLITIHGAVGASLAAIVAISLVGMPKPTQLAAHEPSIPFLGLFRRKRVVLASGIYIWGSGLTFGFAGYWNLKLQAACQLHRSSSFRTFDSALWRARRRHAAWRSFGDDASASPDRSPCWGVRHARAAVTRALDLSEGGFPLPVAAHGVAGYVTRSERFGVCSGGAGNPHTPVGDRGGDRKRCRVSRWGAAPGASDLAWRYRG